MGENIIDFQEQNKLSGKIAGFSLILNVFLTLLKAVVGVLAQSQALIADAVHSGADVAGSFAVLIGLWVAKRPADEDHPYGHGKAEIVAASLVATLLILAGLEVAYSSIRQLFLPVPNQDIWALATGILAVLSKEIVYRYQFRIGNSLHSPALIAGAKDHRSDVYSSLAATLGIGIAMLGTQFHIPALLYADPLAALVVAVLIVHMGYQMAVESYTSLLEQVLTSEETEEMEHIIQKIAGVCRVDNVRARSHGTYLVVDVRISVDPEITVLSGHNIAKDVKQSLMDNFPRIQEVLVHINPYL